MPWNITLSERGNAEYQNLGNYIAIWFRNAYKLKFNMQIACACTMFTMQENLLKNETSYFLHFIVILHAT